MQGKSHLLLGAAGYLGTASVAPELVGSQPLTGTELVCGSLVAAGAAMLPDLDHPQATVSRSLGPVSWLLARVVARVSGGHRNGTHTIWAWALTTIAAAAALQSSSGPWVALGIAFLCASLMLRVLTEADGFVCAALSAVLAAVVVVSAPADGWMTYAVCMGFGLHLLGDLVTTEGIKPLYPFGPRVSVPIVGTTDRWRERTAGALCGLAACYLLATMVFVPAWQDTQNAKASERAPAPKSAPVRERNAEREVKRLREKLNRMRQRESERSVARTA